MGIERKTMAARMRTEHADFVSWLAKQPNGQYGITVSSALDRIVGFMRDLCIAPDDAINPIGVQVLLRKHGLPTSFPAQQEPGLTTPQPLQARLNFYVSLRRSRNRRVELEAGAWGTSCSTKFRFPFVSRRVA